MFYVRQLSSNFSRAAFEKSESAERAGMENKMPLAVRRRASLLCRNVLEPLYAARNFYITSGYRSPELNVQIGGVATSQHCLGEAADIVPYGGEREGAVILLGKIAMQAGLAYDQLINEFGRWIHISHKKSGNRRQELIAYKVAGKTRYKEWRL